MILSKNDDFVEALATKLRKQSFPCPSNEKLIKIDADSGTDKSFIEKKEDKTYPTLHRRKSNSKENNLDCFQNNHDYFYVNEKNETNEVGEESLSENSTYNVISLNTLPGVRQFGWSELPKVIVGADLFKFNKHKYLR